TIRPSQKMQNRYTARRPRATQSPGDVMAVSTPTKSLIGWLLERDLLTPDQADEATTYAEAHAIHPREALTQLEHISDTDIQRAFREGDVPTWDRLTRPTPEALNAINARIAAQPHSVPLTIEAGILTLGMLDPLDNALVRQLERSAGVRLRPHSITVATYRSLTQMLARRAANQSSGRIVIDPDAVKLVPKETAERYRVMPLRMQDGDLYLGVTDDSEDRKSVV